MATTTATLTISSADLTSNPLSITTSSTLYKAGTTIGLEQTTGLAKKVYAAAQSNTTLISAGDFADDTHSRIYIRNSGSSTTDFFTVTIASGNSVIGRLYGGDFLFIPYEGEEDIDISSSATNMELEFMVINEG
jgi:hypothetical protein|tara:strand:+ start:48 stop:449 length:402 start_codon:yes stop_codon:yes gene_type:complete